jgi:hypothetical protein
MAGPANATGKEVVVGAAGEGGVAGNTGVEGAVRKIRVVGENGRGGREGERRLVPVINVWRAPLHDDVGVCECWVSQVPTSSMVR